MEQLSIYQKLLNTQAELKAPKSQFNKGGKYNYRSCEDVLESLKPICVKYGLVVTINDTIECIGDRFYVKATVELHDIDSDKKLSVSAYAREPRDLKIMTESQVTGAASSYARKYALNGLFAIDDNKDSDALPKENEPAPIEQNETNNQPIQQVQNEISPKDMLWQRLKDLGINAKKYALENNLTPDTPPERFMQILNKLNTQTQGA